MYKNNYQKGDKIGVLTFLNRVNINPDKPYANFLCDCGNEFVARIDSVKIERVKSCGCMSGILRSKSLTKHPPKEYHTNGVLKIPFLNKDIINRFWSKIALTANPNKCWIWNGTGERYGGFRMGKATYKSNRIAYFIHYGEDPAEMEVIHSCDNPKCCNPAHLSLGDHYENMQDMKEKGRARNQWSKINGL